ncbi:MAG: DedA family protein, partial [Gammaproteobacteria bacterium]|nr:DedA family protein [Gammaproteobacteria bacterium]
SFAESSFFPIPPDVMLAPMVVASPEKGWRYALITTVMSVIGGLAGFALGALVFDLLFPYLEKFGYTEAFATSQEWFQRWGFWAVLAAGFSPIPYKIFTIAAGAMAMPLAPFALASVVGRGARFYLVAGLLVWGGARVEPMLRKYVEWLGWLFIALLVALYFVVR